MNWRDNMLAEILSTTPEPTVENQPLYERLHAWALRGMGYGLGDHPETSGEKHVLELLSSRTEQKTAGRLDGRQVCYPTWPCPLIIFDVGANVGNWTQMVLARFGRGTLVYCFEPSATAREHLRRLGPSGVFGANAKAFDFGLSDDTGPSGLHADAPGSGMASMYPRRMDHFGRKLGTEELIHVRRLDDVCRDLSVQRIDLLKLDIEGNEYNALVGAGDMLNSGAIRMIQFEFGGCNLDAHTTFQDFWYLLHDRYDLYRVVADGLTPIPAYREELEVYICANFVAVWREP